MDDAVLREGLVECENSQGQEVRGRVLRASGDRLVFETLGAEALLQLSEALRDLRVGFGCRAVYTGRAVVKSLVSTGTTTVYEAALEGFWRDLDSEALRSGASGLRADFASFLRWSEREFKVSPEFKLVVADMQTVLTDLRSWLQQLEVGIRAAPGADRGELEEGVLSGLVEPVLEVIDHLFDKFEHVAGRIEPDLRSVHGRYMKRHLHPLVLCSPFAYRTFTKPLGYAGDYEMINMMVRSPFEGESLFAKILNVWFLRQPPAEAHRHRIGYLTRKLLEEAVRVGSEGRRARVYSLGCGPAIEIQAFLRDTHLSDRVEVVLLDFNDETLQYLSETLHEVKRAHGRVTQLEIQKKAVQRLLRESASGTEPPGDGEYDLIYCAGLFDYLSDQVCRHLMAVLYRKLAPGGLLVVTNVDSSNPLRFGMEHLLDWFLIYRSSRHMSELRPASVPEECLCARSDYTGINHFLEVRKPVHA